MSITHISDTALWVAVHRGRESLRPDALYLDTLALRLAGERGVKIAKNMALAPFMEWMMALRTVAIDGLILDAISLGVTTIVNLGAGLDTRPYRLNIPRTVKWIEVDFPEMIAYKNDSLHGEVPLVNLERVALDLNDREAAGSYYKKLGGSSESILVITEGVIPYLDNEQVANLADDLRSVSNIKFWIHDFREGGYTAGIPKIWLKRKMKFAPFKFAVTDWFNFFESHGWRVRKKHLIHDLALANNRPMPASAGIGILIWLLPKKKLEAYNRSIGFAMLERT